MHFSVEADGWASGMSSALRKVPLPQYQKFIFRCSTQARVTQENIN